MLTGVAAAGVAAGGRRLRRVGVLGVSGLVSGVCLYLATRNVLLEEFWKAFASASLGWLLFAWLMQIGTLVLRAVRWQRIFVEPVGFGPLFWSQNVGYLLNNVLPLRVGDVARVFAAQYLTKLGLFRIGFTLVVERLADVGGLLAAFFVAALFAPMPPAARDAAALLTGAFALAVAAAAAGYVAARVVLHRATFPLVQHFLAEFIRTVEELSVGRLVWLVVWTALGMAAAIAMTWAVMAAFGVRAGWLTALLISVTVSFIMAVPSVPGYFGVFHLGAQVALALSLGAAYDATLGLAVAVTLHGISYVGQTFFGLIGIWFLRRSSRVPVVSTLFARVGAQLRGEEPPVAGAA